MSAQRLARCTSPLHRDKNLGRCGTQKLGKPIQSSSQTYSKFSFVLINNETFITASFKFLDIYTMWAEFNSAHSQNLKPMKTAAVEALIVLTC